MHLAGALSRETPVYAIQSRALRSSAERPKTLREAAKDFTSLMREVQPRGPYAIAGFSAAGVAAMAIAEEVRALGENTDFVGLIDSIPPKSVPIPSPFGRRTATGSAFADGSGPRAGGPERPKRASSALGKRSLRRPARLYTLGRSAARVRAQRR